MTQRGEAKSDGESRRGTARATARRLVPLVLAGGALLAVLATRATLEQVDAFDRAQVLVAAGDTRNAVLAWRQALRWHTPWGPRSDAAADALLAVASQAAANDPELAVEALDALRSGLNAARPLYQPRADLVLHVEKTIPALLVRVAERRGDKRDKRDLLARFEAAYARPVGVSTWASAAVSLGFLLWLAGIVMAARFGVDEAGRWQRAGWRWVGMSIGGFACWALALWLA